MRYYLRLSCALAVFLSFQSCGKKDSDSGSAAIKLRSSGLHSVALSLVESMQAFTVIDTMTANTLELEYYKVPIRRISLISGFDGTKFTSSSASLFSCDASKSDDDCLVDLSKSILVDNLLPQSSVTESLSTSDASYDGAAIDFCKDGASTSDAYKIRVKGSVVMGGTLYYTSATQGLSSSLTAAEEVQLTVTCTSKLVPFLSPLTVSSGKAVSLAIYADPNGNVFGTKSPASASSNCLGSASLGVCAALPSFFLSSDETTPTIERYGLTVTTTKSGNAYRNLLLKFAFQSDGSAIGTTLQEHYRNDTAEKSLTTPLFHLSKVTKNTDSSYELKYFTQDVIKNFKRGTDSGNTVLALVDAPLVFNQKQIQ